MIPTDASPTPAMGEDEPVLAWYFDVISPFAYLQWPAVRALAEVRPIALRPVLLAGLLSHHGHKGPAEIPQKRVFTYRHVLWKARQRGVPLVFPPAHPFNPLAALRLCIAAGSTPAAVTTLFDWIWAGGRDADSPAALAEPARALGIADVATAIAAPAVKDTLRANFDAAIAAGVFGVPTLTIGDDVFWGDDAFDFAQAVLADPGLLADPEMRRATTLPAAATRQAGTRS
jgi:2-hydroxychromene-2-carboxylate isomerase